jgi:hypothetical protein
MWFQSKRVTDRQEGEEPARVVVEKPILSLARALTRPLLRLNLFMKAKKSIFEHGIHQCRLGAYGSQFDPRVKEPFRKHGDGARPLICGGSTGGYRLACLAAVSGAMGGVHLILLFTNRSAATAREHTGRNCQGDRYGNQMVLFSLVNKTLIPTPAERHDDPETGMCHLPSRKV